MSTMLLTGCLRRWDTDTASDEPQNKSPFNSYLCFGLRVHFQSLDIKYLTLHSLDEVLVLFTDEKEEEQEEEDDEEEDSYFGKWTQE